MVGMKVTDDGLKNLANLKKLRHLDLGTIRGYSDDAGIANEGIAKSSSSKTNLQTGPQARN